MSNYNLFFPTWISNRFRDSISSILYSYFTCDFSGIFCPYYIVFSYCMTFGHSWLWQFLRWPWQFWVWIARHFVKYLCLFILCCPCVSLRTTELEICISFSYGPIIMEFCWCGHKRWVAEIILQSYDYTWVFYWITPTGLWLQKCFWEMVTYS